MYTTDQQVTNSMLRMTAALWCFLQCIIIITPSCAFILWRLLTSSNSQKIALNASGQDAQGMLHALMLSYEVIRTSLRGALSVPMNFARGSESIEDPKPRPFRFFPTLSSKQLAFTPWHSWICAG